MGARQIHGFRQGQDWGQYRLGGHKGGWRWEVNVGVSTDRWTGEVSRTEEVVRATVGRGFPFHLEFRVSPEGEDGKEGKFHGRGCVRGRTGAWAGTPKPGVCVVIIRCYPRAKA